MTHGIFTTTAAPQFCLTNKMKEKKDLFFENIGYREDECMLVICTINL